MPNGLHNWCYADLVAFLKEHGFTFLEFRKGSHEAWINRANGAIVEMSFHGTRSFIPKTVTLMIRQSKIAKSVWREWARTKH